jgi:hypothetical protein
MNTLRSIYQILWSETLSAPSRLRPLRGNILDTPLISHRVCFKLREQERRGNAKEVGRKRARGTPGKPDKGNPQNPAGVYYVNVCGRRFHLGLMQPRGVL